jgi:hypothetical protein
MLTATDAAILEALGEEPTLILAVRGATPDIIDGVTCLRTEADRASPRHNAQP